VKSALPYGERRLLLSHDETTVGFHNYGRSVSYVSAVVNPVMIG
jgi:hypothetical protein